MKPYIGPLSTSFSNFSRNLGVIVNQNLNFDSHIHKLTQTCFIPLRILLVALAWFGCPSSRGLESLIHTFIFSQLDYCNGIFSCLIQAVLLCWQLMQNAAARLLTKPAADHLYLYLHMIPILHKLPIKYKTSIQDSGSPCLASLILLPLCRDLKDKRFLLIKSYILSLSWRCVVSAESMS